MRYQADTWEHARRVVLVVVERPGELLLDYFWLITNLRADRYSGARLLGLYRMRGKAEGHMGELMDVLAPACQWQSKTAHSWQSKIAHIHEVPVAGCRDLGRGR